MFLYFIGHIPLTRNIYENKFNMFDDVGIKTILT